VDGARSERGERVVIVGAGFGGLSCALGLARTNHAVTVIDRHNYHLFQPLLYQVATAGLSPADIAYPIRAALRDARNVSVVLAKATGVDTRRREVIADGRRFAYDKLVIATGARHDYFGRDEWEAVAHGLKTIDDATALRRRILLAFEKAETEDDAGERRRLLNFVVVGGGPTGVEMAGAICELARKALAADFRRIDPRETRVVLIEAGSRLLPSFDETLSTRAARDLGELGVEVRLGTPVTACEDDGVAIGSDWIETRTIVWAAGVRASAASRWLDVTADRAGRVVVGGDLSVPGHPDVFVIGDTASARGADGRPLPGVAPVAKQQGEYVARLLKARGEGRDLGPFAYRDHGSTATIGRKRAVLQVGRWRIAGFPAWALWSLVHVYYLIGFRSRVAVATNWMWSYLTFQRGTRLITGGTTPEEARLVTARPSRARDAA
jgi:NADH dehydrogenase